ncbi:MAG: hypothetical protein EG828_10300 [Deltaproteobacteria bacterium]|nr:hypothetical protein [Deltaproteobacteria bacterium]
MIIRNSHPHPTLPQLIKATGIAVILACAILVTAVLPAEFGIDPTGVGRVMGLTAMNAAEASTTQSPLFSIASLFGMRSAVTMAKSKAPLRNDDMSVTLQPAEGAEIKAYMRKGDQFVFNWSAEGGPVNFDMHGEKPNDDGRFTSYWKGMQQTGAQGAFLAPFDGTHGWYWRNRGDKPVTVKLKVSGFYEKVARLK